jgi:argininosuccinate lyase
MRKFTLYVQFHKNFLIPQVLVATRLFLKDQLRGLIENCVKIAEICLARAEEKVPMPGYTHLQRAVVSSTGMWFAGWAEAFIEDGNRFGHLASLTFLIEIP